MPSNCRFVALSYVWGSEQSSLRLEDAPATIKDSITVTLALGYDYLWVDRSCINQSDSRDQNSQIRQMSDIYGAAQLTIIAAAGEDPSYGLPGVGIRPTPQIYHFENINQIYLVTQPEIGPSAPSIEASTSRWHSRAWTFQECFSSRRRLFFTDTAVFFICNSGVGRELIDPIWNVRGAL
ncbi:HET domain containing protein [Pyrenophora tritici-repentis]|uniref:HET domain containing protein n=1 Tax=Pyrenophora tritici-repentis TaxID=45151 RepID=A0A2W1HTD0_9PLEO|nr:HET domain-containing protein [Pyrenophora tritici-repentis]KAF7442202.1 HET domain containing protein [Pyrenophora tritici-repentis]KAF7579437.1 HET domain containing protein [Pyrenophora tritici-repentis]KAG9378350.1 HET domain containing protein [Pyrenophora tritici-repentis]KAI0572400.1 HET domain-containing protein [Pyrenophora tritici-repentis]